MKRLIGLLALAVGLGITTPQVAKANAWHDALRSVGINPSDVDITPEISECGIGVPPGSCGSDIPVMPSSGDPREGDQYVTWVQRNYLTYIGVTWSDDGEHWAWLAGNQSEYQAESYAKDACSQCEWYATFSNAYANYVMVVSDGTYSGVGGGDTISNAYLNAYEDAQDAGGVTGRIQPVLTLRNLPNGWPEYGHYDVEMPQGRVFDPYHEAYFNTPANYGY